ncbi:MAG: hypothetical protein PHN74_03545 [Candidatus Pacebacteria bacterium]|nr:hypothetical protein [Candidatus Paceibacterota bacterium]
MNYKIKFLNTAATAIILGIMIFPLFGFLIPQKANAVWGVGDVTSVFPVPGSVFPTVETNPAVVAGSAAAGEGAQGTLAEMLLNASLKVAGQEFKKAILDRFVDNLITWINNDGQGQVVEDWNSFFINAADTAIGNFIYDTGNFRDLCSPFGFQVQLLLSTPKAFNVRTKCSLSQIVQNIQTFYDDFRQGGWIAYNYQWDPRNNFYGASIMAFDEAQKQAAAATEASKSEAESSSGFLGMKNCKVVSGKKVCSITMPGNLVGNAASEALIKIPTNSIINADDLAGYLGAILDAAINRLTIAGVKGLQKATSDNLPPTDLCLGLSDNPVIYAQCKEMNKGSDNILRRAKIVFLKQISDTITPRIKADETLMMASSTEQALITNLNTLSTTCSVAAINIVVEQISTNTTAVNISSLITREQSVLTRIKTAIVNNKAIIDQLENARAKLNQTNNVSAIYSEFQTLIDANAADTFLGDATATKTTVENTVSSVKTDLDAKFEACGQNPLPM